MIKYYEVAKWYIGQHPVMFIVLGLAVVAIAGMIYMASQEVKKFEREV